MQGEITHFKPVYFLQGQSAQIQRIIHLSCFTCFRPSRRHPSPYHRTLDLNHKQSEKHRNLWNLESYGTGRRHVVLKTLLQNHQLSVNINPHLPSLSFLPLVHLLPPMPNQPMCKTRFIKNMKNNDKEGRKGRKRITGRKKPLKKLISVPPWTVSQPASTPMAWSSHSYLRKWIY